MTAYRALRMTSLFLIAITLGACASTGSAFQVGSAGRHVVVASSGASLPLSSVSNETDRLKIGSHRGVEVAYTGPEAPGTIIIETARPRLLMVFEGGRALQFRVAVGRPEHQWYGQKAIESKHLLPAWSAPDVVSRANPAIAGVVIPAGASNNPMGLGALVLTGGEYAIHGTNRPESIGGAVSFGCFRMYNEDIAELLRRSTVGSKVIVR